MKNLTWLAFVVPAACVTAAEDGPDDTFLSADGKADTGGIIDGSPEALGVLRVANEETVHDLHDAGVSTRAAENIVAYRDGDDGTPGTADDATFDTLTLLDAVPYVGPVAFRHLLDEAREKGYVVPVAVTPDAYTLPSCTPMAYADLAGHFQTALSFPDGSFYRASPVGGFTLTGRSRESCNPVIGCTPWRDPFFVETVQVGDLPGYPSGSAHTLPASGNAALEFEGLNSTFRLQLEAFEPGTPGNTIRVRCGDIHPDQVADGVDCSVAVVLPHDASAPEDGRIIGFLERYQGHLIFGNTTMMSWRGRICADGRYQFVTKLGPEISSTIRIDGANNKNQISISGRM
jgi:hypothetical protein